MTRSRPPRREAAVPSPSSKLPPPPPPSPVVALLHPGGDAALGAVLHGVRAAFPGARVTLVTVAGRTRDDWPVAAHRAHTGDVRILLRWLRSCRWDAVAVTWTGEPGLVHWKAALPWLARTRQRVAFDERGAAIPLAWRGSGRWAGHLRRRLAEGGARAFRARALAGPLAVLAVATAVPRVALVLMTVGLRDLA